MQQQNENYIEIGFFAFRIGGKFIDCPMYIKVPNTQKKNIDMSMSKMFNNIAKLCSDKLIEQIQNAKAI